MNNAVAAINGGGSNDPNGTGTGFAIMALSCMMVNTSSRKDVGPEEAVDFVGF